MKRNINHFNNRWILLLAGVWFAACNKDLGYSTALQPYVGPEYYKLLVSARPDTLIVMPANSLELYADTSSQNPITAIEWRMISGPSQVNFSQPNALRTTVTNLDSGWYQFEIKITDNQQKQVADTVKVLVEKILSQSNCGTGKMIVRTNLKWYNPWYDELSIADYVTLSSGVEPCQVLYRNNDGADWKVVPQATDTTTTLPYYIILQTQGAVANGSLIIYSTGEDYQARPTVIIRF